jgi:hypothetical protein
MNRSNERVIENCVKGLERVNVLYDYDHDQ